jgi:uncharacterized membrane protein required for colicin V production
VIWQLRAVRKAGASLTEVPHRYCLHGERRQPSMSLPDLLVALVFLLLVANAARRGFLREGSLLFGLGLALWLAGQLYRQLGSTLPSPGPWLLVMYFGLALMLLIAAAAVSALASPLMRRGPLLVADRAAGTLVGVIEAAVIVGLLMIVAGRLGAISVPTDGLAARSVDVAGLSLSWLAATIPPEVLSPVGFR